MKPLIVFILITLVFYSCTDKIVNKATSEENTGLSFSIDLSKAPIDVVDVKGTLSRIGYDSIFIDFDISNNNAKAVINDIFPGKWHLRVDVYSEAGTIAYSGSTEAEVVSGTITPVSLHLNPTTGGLDIVVTWGEADLNYGLMANYPFNGNANDESENQNNGTIHGASLTTDRFNNPNSAFQFDGMNDYINISSPANFNYMDSFTISAWIYPNQDSKKQYIISKASPNRDFALRLTLENHFDFHFNDGNYRFCFSEEIFELNTWTHIVGIWTGTHSKLYINGQLVQTREYSSNQPPWSGDLMQIGAIAGGEFFNGKIDEIRIYNYDLSDEKIEELFSLQ